MVLIGGAGDYSVPEGGAWLEAALDAMRELDTLSKPTFASCWGFQAMAAALGGEVITDDTLAEIGTLELALTKEGMNDPLFKEIGPTFLAHVGHHDTVSQLPPGTTCLAKTDLVANHAFRVDDKPIYCTQFHSELPVRVMRERVVNYPHYVERIAGMSVQKFMDSLQETPEANGLMRRFVSHVFAD